MVNISTRIDTRNAFSSCLSAVYESNKAYFRQGFFVVREDDGMTERPVNEQEFKRVIDGGKWLSKLLRLRESKPETDLPALIEQEFQTYELQHRVFHDEQPLPESLKPIRLMEDFLYSLAEGGLLRETASPQAEGMERFVQANLQDICLMLELTAQVTHETLRSRDTRPLPSL